jgi:hypothetical protein
MMLNQDCLNRCNPSTAEPIIALLVSLLLRSDPVAERTMEASSQVSCAFGDRDRDRDGGGVIRAMFDGPASHIACGAGRVESPRRRVGSIQAIWWFEEELVIMAGDDMSETRRETVDGGLRARYGRGRMYFT